MADRPDTAAVTARRRGAALAACALLLLPGLARAEPAFARLYKAQFGYAPSCNACHKDGGGTPLNPYGQSFKDEGMNAAAWAAIAARDADGDGATNEAEARAKANPGAAASTPAQPGAWLDVASLIPREVQAAFPGVREYLPRDALITDADIARARALGATLAKADENTIYVPLVDKRPAGTALIFPAEHEGKTFFLLMTTDRQLVVTAVAPMNASQVPAAEKRAVYATFKGVPVDRLPAPQGNSLDAAITAAVKKAGALLWVRLKNA